MSELLSSVSQQLLAPGGLELDSLPGILHELNGPGIDAADLYFQSQVSESWMLEDGIVKEGSFNLDQGVGVRAQSGEKTGFAYSNAITAEALKQAAVAAVRFPVRDRTAAYRRSRPWCRFACTPARTRWTCSAVPRRSSC